MNITDGKRENYEGPNAWFVDSEVWLASDRDMRRKVYDRLRKRSYRWWDPWWSGHARDMHQAYVKGVRDALNELPYG